MSEGPSNVLVRELTGRLILLPVAVFSFRFGWWWPLVVAPMFWMILDFLFLRGSPGAHLSIETSLAHVFVQRRIANFLTWLMTISYMVYSVFAFYLYVNLPCAWLIGLGVGIMIAQVLGFLTPARRREEWAIERERLRARGVE